MRRSLARVPSALTHHHHNISSSHLSTSSTSSSLVAVTPVSSPAAGTLSCPRCHAFAQSQHRTALATRLVLPRSQSFSTASPLQLRRPKRSPTVRANVRRLRDGEQGSDVRQEQQQTSGEGGELVAKDAVQAQAQVQDAVDNYEPAETWHGLERVGGPTGWWEEAWDRENVFEGFMAPVKIDEVAMEGTVRRAAIEVLALREAGRPMTDATNTEALTTFDYGQIELENNGGSPALKCANPAVKSELLDLIPEPTEQADLDVKSSENNRLGIGIKEPRVSRDFVASTKSGEASSMKPSWHDISVADPALKFAIVKRVTQLSGARIPDPAIAGFRTIGDIVRTLATKPKPKKLAELLLSMPELAALPNVEVLTSRYTPVHQEMEVGRWKVIKKRLREEGLPVTGSR